MEGVDHIYVCEVGGCSLVGEVNGVRERNVPDREGLELCIARLDALLAFVVDLREAGSHLARAGAGGGDDDEGAAGFGIFVLTEALLGHDEGDIVGVAVYLVVLVHLYAEVLKLGLEGVGGRVGLIARHNDATDVEAVAAECVDKAKDVEVIGYTYVAPDLVLLDIGGIYGDDYFGDVLKLDKHLYLTVGSEAREHARCVEVVKKLAAKFKVELFSKKRYTLLDLLRLQFQIFFVIKSLFKHTVTSKFLN